MTGRVLVSDRLSETAVQVMRDRGLAVDYEPELGADKDGLLARIGGYDGLAIRSATKVTDKLLSRAERLKVVGRAGIGIDNVELAAATSRGIVVMNTPFGNAITTAEHTVALMMALARQIPEADHSMRAGKWLKNRFIGVELYSKTLGIIGCGNIGSIVAERAIGLRMKVIAFDPFLSPERAIELGVEKVTFEELLRRADFISLHTPLTDKTRNIIDAAAIARMRRGVRIINCARGGLLVESALIEALRSGHVAGAALDVFETEPPTDNPLTAMEQVVMTPHLGASTSEAQENVAVQIANQLADFLISGAVSNALNMPSISVEEAPRLKPYVALAEQLGSFAGQLTESSLVGIAIEYAGEVGELNTRALTSALLAALLRPMLGDVNMVSAPAVARERGIRVDEIRQTHRGVYDSYIRLTVRTESLERSIAGTVFSDGKPRVIQIKGINMEAELGPHMLYVTNADKPGFIGAFGTILGDRGVNIATFHLGRDQPGGNAIALVEVDGPVPPSVLAAVEALPQVKQARALRF
ncbi:MAG TPA: phosphoglycerate dehydrogenase [Aestuariivirgaceae bacterium]|jgi:D-3-phosphoglycerate dehydrogenase / 2-oxoglutarate reductase|nr:phosphoglycerate dehydrogenase [Aestuariivirgaceae bacterium]